MPVDPTSWKFYWMLMVAVFAPALWAEDQAARVIVLANSSSRESMDLARYYVEKRLIPLENIVTFRMPLAETIKWRDFIDLIYQPVQDELLRRGWLEGTSIASTDKLGRKRHVILDHRIAYLVVCRGVPLRIEHDPSIYAEDPSNLRRPEFRTNCGAVDAELAMIARPGYPIDGLIPNPLFQKDRTTLLDRAKVVKTARLDGPGYNVAAALVDSALHAEATGLIGRAYVDIGGPHAQGDEWMEQVAGLLENAGFDTTVDRSPATFSNLSRFDAPALYFGWYRGDVNGPFAEPGFKFPPGAIALHLHSFSGRTLNSTGEGWCGPLVARGVTGTFGNVFEPYLFFTHHPHLLLKALIRGETLGDATFYALPALSWQGVMIGDPLYRPFKVSFANQWERRNELTAESRAYVALREACRLERENASFEALALVEDELKRAPHWALAIKEVQLLIGAGRSEDASKRLRDRCEVLTLRAKDSLLFWTAVDSLLEKSSDADAVFLLKMLLQIQNLPSAVHRGLLLQGEKSARAAGDVVRADEWTRELNVIGAGIR